MNNIIEAENIKVQVLEEKTTEELTAEVNSLYVQIETIGNVGCMMMAEAGKRLNIIKEKVGHGSWGKWVQDNLSFSQSKAEYMMKYASKMEIEGSVFSNSQTFGNLGVSRLFALLDAPEEVAEEVSKMENVEELSVKEFKEEIKRLKEENEILKPLKEKVSDLERELAEKEEATNEIDNSAVEEEIERLKGQINEAISNLEKEKQELRMSRAELAQLKKETETKILDAVTEEKEKAEQDRKKLEESLRKEISNDNEKEKNELKDKYREAQDQIASLERKLKNSSQQDVAIFKVKSTSLQEDFNSCLDSIDKMSSDDEDMAQKMKNALKIIMTQLIERI